MDKLAWVWLPLLLGGAGVAWLALRGRAPSRLTLNVLSSLLLLAYLATTAGLGIFWVAHQHLPVFDWHYLFGYATVALLALHLLFNLPLVGRWLRQRRARPVPLPVATTAATANAAPPRRRLLGGAFGAAGVAVAGVAGFALGVRQGRTELHVSVGAAGGAGAADGTGAAAARAAAWAAVERFHAHTSHSRLAVVRRAASAGWSTAPPPFKDYPAAPRQTLPPPQRNPRVALAAGGPALSTPPPGVDALATLLWHTVGISQWRGGIAFRVAPSSGALFATELYAVSRGLAGVDDGTWHYGPQHHALHRLGPPATLSLADDAAAPLRIVFGAVFARSGHKYGDRAYRYVLADLGHAVANLLATASAIGWRAAPEAVFDESRIAAALGLDEEVEGVVAVVSLSTGDTDPRARERTAPAVADAVRMRPEAAASRRWQPPPLTTAPGEGWAPTQAIHRATSLRAAGPSPAVATVLPPGSAPLALPRTPPATAAAAAVLDVIARRRSVRRFASAPLALADLWAVLDAMVARRPPLLSHAVRVHVVAHDVDGLAAGAWRCEAGGSALRPRRVDASLREAAQRAALDQDVIGNAAAVVVLTLDRAALAADPAGSARGWRHGFIEAGLIGERMYLEAGAHGLGVCAVGAFYDDEAAQLIGIDAADEWVVHFAALGVPA